MKPYFNMRYIDGFYLPMVELVKYLYDNDFEIWVISGTERTTTRAIVANSPIRDYVEPEHVIGTDFEVKQRGHEDEPSNMDFKYENGDELVLTGGFIQKNLNGNKSIYVEREIGKRPVLAFGNSGSDTSMMNYAIDERNPYLAQAYMIVADDSEREWGQQDWEAKSADYLAKGFIPISMKTDFAQIYPDGITKADEQYVPADVQPSETESQALREQLIAVYSIGWMVTEEMTSEYPQVVPAFGETDTGTVICFDCEDGNVSETIVIPAGMKALSINPLNWKTDGTPADKSLNHGAVFEAGGEPVPELCGAYIGEKGELIVTDVTAADYPPGLDVFPEGAYHLYDYMFFFTNLKENVAMRTAVWSAQHNLYGAAA